ncbi:MAG: hypothetical protein GEV12_22485 [Micromonosporaceae bacterium]|nr:hypothetical protein [Micromonosporaceae bacterium]
MAFWIVVAIVMFLCLGGTGFVLRLVEGRRGYRLNLKREEARIAEAQAKELEIQHRRAELAYREALLELERFDRRTGTDRGLPRPSGPEPFDPLQPPNPA